MLQRATKGLGTEAVKFATTQFADVIENFTTEERQQLGTLLAVVSRARLRELAGEEISEDVEILEDALTQWKVAGRIELVSIFKETSIHVLGLGGEFLGGLLRGFIARI